MTLKRPNGAEEPDYRAAGLSYKPANGPFQAIEELQLVLGMRPEIYRRIAPFDHGVLAPARREHAAREPRGAARASRASRRRSWTTTSRAARRRAPRASRCRRSRRAPASRRASRWSPSIRRAAQLEDGTVFVREAVAMLRPAPRKPVTFVAWRQLAGRWPPMRRRPAASETSNALMAATPDIHGPRSTACAARRARRLLALVARRAAAHACRSASRRWAARPDCRCRSSRATSSSLVDPRAAAAAEKRVDLAGLDEPRGARRGAHAARSARARRAGARARRCATTRRWCAA